MKRIVAFLLLLCISVLAIGAAAFERPVDVSSIDMGENYITAPIPEEFETTHGIEDRREPSQRSSVSIFETQTVEPQPYVGVMVVIVAFSDTPDSMLSSAFGASVKEVLTGTTGSVKSNLYNLSGGVTDLHVHAPQIASDGSLTVVKSNRPRSYFESYQQHINPDGYMYSPQGGASQESYERLYELFEGALNTLDKQAIIDAELDGDGNGEVDNVLFLFPTPRGKWNDALWPHKFGLQYINPIRENYSISDGLYIDTYNFIDYDIDSITATHEMLHSLGLSDMYNYDDNSKRIVEEWSIMGKSECANLTSYELESLGWLTVPTLEVTAMSKRITLNALGSSKENVAYKIPIEGTDSTLYLEYRDTRAEGIPNYDSGLVVWRYDELGYMLSGNRYGPPYQLYPYRALSGEDCKGDVAKSAFSDKNGRTRIGYDLDGNPTSAALDIPIYNLFCALETEMLPTDELFPYVHAEDGGAFFTRLIGAVSANISIYNVTESDGTLSFTIKTGGMGCVNDPVFSHAPDSYSSDISLELSSYDDSPIYYTLDGSEPTADSTLYTGSINISGAVLVRAVCINSSGESSNIVDAQYYCYSNVSMPYYDGSGRTSLSYATENDIVILSFGEPSATPSGYFGIIDEKSSEWLMYVSAQSLIGKTVALSTSGRLRIECGSQAYYRISYIGGYKQAVSRVGGFSFLNSDLSSATQLIPGEEYYAQSYLRNNSYQYKQCYVVFAFYDDNRRMVEVALADEYIFDSDFTYRTAAKFTFDSEIKSVRMFVIDKQPTLAPLMRA